MESIKETELNLQREVVTTVPNTWLVEAVNPSTGDKKMIDIANYASVVAGVTIQRETTKISVPANYSESLNTGITKKGIFSVGLGSIDYNQPLFLVFSNAVELLNEAWFSSDIHFSKNEAGELCFTYNRSTSTTIFITRISGV